MKWILWLTCILHSGIIFSQSSVYRMRDHVQSSISKKDILYIDIDNYLTVNLPDSLQLHYSTYNGFIDTDSTLNLIPQRPGICRLKVYSLNKGDTNLLGIRSFTVKKIPLPTMYLDTVELVETIGFPKKFISTDKQFHVHVSEDIIGSEQWFKVDRYTIILNQRGKYLSKQINGPRIDEDARKFLCQNRYPTKFILHFEVEADSDIIIQHRLQYTITVF